MRPQTVTEGVYQYLRDEILTGRLAAGQRILEKELAHSLNVSRTPIREAVRQLAQEGLLVVKPNRGVYVRTLTLSEAIATYEVRESLESMAARLAARHADKAAIRDLEDRLVAFSTVSEGDFAELIRTDDALHKQIAHMAGNPVLFELIEKLSQRVMRVKILTRDVITSPLARTQHLAIVAAIVAGKEEESEVAMATHIRANLEIVMSRLTNAEQADSVAIES